MSKKKKIEKFENLLAKYVKKRELVKIFRNVTEGEANIYGLILKQSDEFLHLTENNEFKFNGEVIIKSNHFHSIRSNKYEKAIRKILIKEKKLNLNKPNRTDLDLSSWNSVFKGLKKKDIHVIIECEDLKNPTFTIGPIEKVNSKTVDIKYYDATGKLNKKTTRIKFKNITLLRFNDRYSTIFRKYLK